MNLLSPPLPELALPGPIGDDPLVPQSTQVDVLAPTAGMAFIAGQPLTLQWRTLGPVDAHAVLLSTDGGTTFTNVSGSDLPGSANSFAFVLPLPPAATAQAVVRVRAKLGGNGVSRGDSAPFTLTVQDLIAPQVSVTSPRAGQRLVIGEPVSIAWNSSDNVGLVSHKVLLSTDGGANFRDISPQLPGSARSFNYTPLSADTASQAVVRVAARDAVGNRGTGDAGPIGIGAAFPVIERIVPAEGYAEQSVQLQGRGLAHARRVFFGYTEAGFRVLDDAALAAGVPILRTPAQGPVAVNVSVQTDAGTVFAPQPFVVTPLPAPRIDRLEPPTAAVGEFVRLLGSGLLQIGAAPTTLSFPDGVPAPFIRSDPQGSGAFIESQVPAGARSGLLRLTTPGGVATVPFTLRGSVQTPVIDSIAPGSGGTGTTVMISGRGFAGVSVVDPQRGVFFKGLSGEVRAPIANASDTSLIVQVPAGAITGTLRISAEGGSATSPAAFIVPPVAMAAVSLSASPAAASIASGAAASYTVTIARSNFDGPVTLAVDGLPSGASADFSPNPVPSGISQLTVGTGAGTTTLGMRTLTIRGSAGNVPVAPATVQLAVGIPPSISGFDPGIGAAGTQASIFGTGLAFTTGVAFAGVPASFFASPDGALLATVPEGAGRGPIAVATPFGTAISAAEFVVPAAAAPMIDGFTPARGAPGTAVRLAGRNFVNLVSVDLGGALLQNVITSAGGTRIDATLPPNANTGRFLVRTASGSALSEGLFIVDAIPSPPPPSELLAVTGLKPGRGRVGTPVSVVGTGFVDGATSLSFNGVPAPVSVIDAARLATVVPPGASSGPVVVQTATGQAASPFPFIVTVI